MLGMPRWCQGRYRPAPLESRLGVVRVIKTRLTETLGIDHPVMLAGMGGVAYAPLAAAVSAAGGIGTLGAATMDDERMLAEMADVARLAPGKPFGVDLLAAIPADMVSQVEKIIAAGATLFVSGLGVPRDVIDLCHSSGVLVASMCGKVRHAVAAVEAGCDIVIAQGTEAGGHTGLVATMPLVPQIVDAVGERVPVVAAGGIYDGRGLAASLALGADGVWIGTRFVATPEARTAIGYKEALLGMAEDGTTVSRAYSGKPMRVIANEYTRHFEANPGDLEPFPSQLLRSMGDGAMHLQQGPEEPSIDTERECYPTGQAAGGIEDLVPAADLVAQIVREAEVELRRLGSMVS